MKSFPILIALLFTITASFAQKTGGISGKIINENGQPVEDAIVTLLQDSTRAITSSITDTEGNYRIRPVKPGNYSVRITERFHEVKTLNNFPVYKNKFVILDVTLTQPGMASRQVNKNGEGWYYIQLRAGFDKAIITIPL